MINHKLMKLSVYTICIATLVIIAVSTSIITLENKSTSNEGMTDIVAVPKLSALIEATTDPVEYNVNNIDFNNNRSLKMLSNHDVDCKEMPINTFKFENIKDNNNKNASAYYRYRCSIGGSHKYEIANVKEAKNNGTWNDANRYKVIGLTNTDEVTCGENSYIKQFKYDYNDTNANNGNNSKYKFTCLKSNVPLTCRQLKTDEYSLGSNSNGAVDYLDGHLIKCEPDEALSSFKYMKGTDTTKGYYSYTCCKPVSL